MTRTLTTPLLLCAILALTGGCESQPQARVMESSADVSSGSPNPAAAPAPKPTHSQLGAVKVDLPTGKAHHSAIQVQKSAPSEVLVGKAFVWKIQLTNITDVDLENVTLTETAPELMQVVSVDPQGQRVARTVTWTVGRLAARETKPFLISGMATRVGELRGCSKVTYDIPKVCMQIVAVEPSLVIAKTAPDEVILCDPIPTTITVQNTGSGPATDVIVTDTLPEGLSTLKGDSEVIFEVGTLQAGQQRQFTVETKAARTGTYVNRAVVTAAGDISAQATAQTVVRKPILVLSKTGPDLRYLGRNAEYTILVRNTGDAPARNTVLTDMLPEGVELVRATEGASQSGNKLTWGLGTIEVGQSIEATVTVKPMKIGTIVNRAVVQAYCAEASGEALTEIRGIPAILLETIDIEDPIEIGASETYVIAVTNQGSADDTNIRIVCTLPEQQQYVSSTGPTDASVDGQTVTFAPLPLLPPKQKATYRVVVKGIGTGDVRFRTTLTSDQIKTPVTETESTNIYK